MLLSTTPLWSQNGPYHEELRQLLVDPLTDEVQVVAYVTTIDGLRAAGLLKSRALTRVLVRPPDGLTRTGAEALLERCSRADDFEVRQLRAGADQQLAHLKVIWFHREGRSYAIVGSSNLTRAGLSQNLEINVLLDDSCEDFGRLEKLLDLLWSDEQSEPLRPSAFVTEMVYGDNRRVAHLLEFQRDILAQLTACYEDAKSGTGALMHLPTGTGKTVVATRFLLDQVLNEPDVRVLWLAPKRELAVQAAVTFAEQRPFFLYPQLAVEAPEVIRTRDARELETDYNVIFRTLHTASKRADGQRFDVVVLDEAHWGASRSGRLLNDLLENLDVGFFLGLTATPFRRDARELSLLRETFQTLIGPRKGHDPTKASDAAGRPVLARVIHERHDTGVSIALDPRNLMAFELNNATLREFNDDDRNEFIAETYNPKRHGQTLVFAYDTQHANALCLAFAEAHPELSLQVLHTGDIHDELNLVVPPLDEKFTDTARAEIYQLFRRQEIDVLIGVNLYVMGVDFPSIQTLFMARPTLSPVLYTQMRGRGIRGPAFGGTETVRIVDFADQIDTHHELRERLMDCVKAERHSEEIERRRRLWARIERLERKDLARDVQWMDIGPAVYRAFTKGGALRKSIRAIKGLSGAIERALESRTSPIRPEHLIFYFEPTPTLPLDLIEAYVREFDPDDEYKT